MNIIKSKSNKDITHISFELMLLFKGIFALGEILIGITMAFMNPDRMNRLIDFITKNELIEDPKDSLMNYIVNYGNNFSVSTQQFMVFYLLSHGIVKLTVILLLWKKKLWAYPLSIVMFIGFIAYQIYRYTHTHSVMLLFLTAVDIVMIVLTVLEYRNIKVKITK